MALARLLSIFSLALVCASACAMPFVRPGNHINADWDGLPRLSEAQRPFPFFGRNRQESTAYIKGIDSLLDRLTHCISAHVEGAPSTETPRVVIFLHGGLNGLSNALARTSEFNSRKTSRVAGSPPTENEKQCTGDDEAGELQQESKAWADSPPRRTALIDDDTFRRLSKSHWIFLNWDSGFGSSFAEDACCIRLGRRLWTFWVDIPVLLLSKALDTLGQLPYTFNAFAYNARSRGFEPSKAHPLNICPSEFRGPDAADRTHPLDPVAFVPQAFWAQGVKFIGMGGWDSMKRRAELVMDPGFDWDLALLYHGQGDDHTPEHKRIGGVGYHLFSTIIRNTTRTGDGRSPNPVWKLPGGREREIELVLVAHSMGTIVANRILSNYPRLFFSRIIYLGAAASIRSVQADVYPYLRLNPHSGFWSFMLQPADEARDRFGFGSALRWVDIYLERVGTPKGVTFGSSINVRENVNVPNDVLKQVSIVEVSGPGRPRDHESLGDWPFIDTALERALARRDCW